MLPRDRLNPPDPSDSDDPPDYIEDNDPEDALKRRDPEKPLMDEQNPEGGVREISEPDNPDRRSPY